MRTKNQRETICRYCTRLPRSCAGSVLRQLRSERPKLLGWLGDPETPPKRPSGRLLQWGAISSVSSNGCLRPRVPYRITAPPDDCFGPDAGLPVVLAGSTGVATRAHAALLMELSVSDFLPRLLFFPYRLRAGEF